MEAKGLGLKCVIVLICQCIVTKWYNDYQRYSIHDDSQPYYTLRNASGAEKKGTVPKCDRPRLLSCPPRRRPATTLLRRLAAAATAPGKRPSRRRPAGEASRPSNLVSSWSSRSGWRRFPELFMNAHKHTRMSLSVFCCVQQLSDTQLCPDCTNNYYGTKAVQNVFFLLNFNLFHFLLKYISEPLLSYFYLLEQNFYFYHSIFFVHTNLHFYSSAGCELLPPLTINESSAQICTNTHTVTCRYFHMLWMVRSS